MLAGASMLAMVRQELSKVSPRDFVVTDGSHQEGCDAYEVVIRCGSSGDAVIRRLRESMPDADIDQIADDVIGLRKSRRGNYG